MSIKTKCHLLAVALLFSVNALMAGAQAQAAPVATSTTASVAKQKLVIKKHTIRKSKTKSGAMAVAKSAGGATPQTFSEGCDLEEDAEACDFITDSWSFSYYYAFTGGGGATYDTEVFEVIEVNGQATRECAISINGVAASMNNCTLDSVDFGLIPILDQMTYESREGLSDAINELVAEKISKCVTSSGTKAGDTYGTNGLYPTASQAASNQLGLPKPKAGSKVDVQYGDGNTYTFTIEYISNTLSLRDPVPIPKSATNCPSQT